MLAWNDIMYIAKSSLIVTKNELCNYDSLEEDGRIREPTLLEFQLSKSTRYQDGSYFIEF